MTTEAKTEEMVPLNCDLVTVQDAAELLFSYGFLYVLRYGKVVTWKFKDLSFTPIKGCKLLVVGSDNEGRYLVIREDDKDEVLILLKEMLEADRAKRERDSVDTQEEKGDDEE